MELRETFDTVAELYDRARPSYPDELVDDLCEVTGDRVLEIATCCATAWHWLDPSIAPAKGARTAASRRRARRHRDVLSTYSGHIAMTDDQREILFDGVRRLAGSRPIRKHHLFCLHLARRID